MPNIKRFCLVFLDITLFFVNVSAENENLSNKPFYSVCFTSGQQCTTLVVTTIGEEKASIFVQAYSFTSLEIANALIEAKKRGLQVSVILDKSLLRERYSQLKNLSNAETPIWIDSKVAIAHDKVMVIDNKTVITGSFNFTSAAQKRNAENVLIVKNSELSIQYLDNWKKRQEQSYSFKN